MKPFCFRHKVTQEELAVPCGKCPGCVARRTSEWSFRLLHEDKVSNSSLFITLTYDTAHVPITKNGFMSLDKRALQLFFKRLRKLQMPKVDETQKSIKYYAVGEYGGNTSRPHYHIILFNARIDLIALAWTLGNIHYGTVTAQSVGYTLKYICKKGMIPIHIKDDREKEFGVMSKGLGKSYISEAMIKWHHDALDDRMYCTLPGGEKIGMSRYFKEKIYTEMERKRVGFFTRLRMIKELEQKLAEDPNYERNKQEANEAAFRLMYKKRSFNQKI